MIVTTPFGNKVSCGVSRNMLVNTKPDGSGDDVRVALIVIEHENGVQQRHVIREDKILFEGEGIIAREVAIEAAKGGILVGSADATVQPE